MKKSMLFFSAFLALATIHPAAASEAEKINFDRLGAKCFELAATFEPQNTDTAKVQAVPHDQVFFVQDGELLARKIFQHGEERFLEYDVTDVSGAGNDGAKGVALLNDGDPETTFEFDPYDNKPKEITLDLRQVLQANSFRFQIFHDGGLVPRFSVSVDGLEYISVRNVGDFDVRYIRIGFEKPSAKDTTAHRLLIGEINVLQEEKSVFLVRPISTASITAFARFTCEDGEDFRKAVNQVGKISSQTAFAINAETREFELEFEQNAAYNDDYDSDGITNDADNCPYRPNPDQQDDDGDLVGNACDFDPDRKNPADSDVDSDGIGSSLDNCPYVYNPKQQDSNGDGRGDLCSDDDADEIIGYKDNCPNVSNRDQKDVNINGIGDACEFDKDDDGIFDAIDNCITVPNPSQEDADRDAIGDACDNCELYNPTQIDRDGNGKGDRCDEEEKRLAENDKDNDGVIDSSDNCRQVANPDQKDTDKDSVGDACDNCPALQNLTQEDINENGIGDMCEDVDGDGVEGFVDNCPYHANAGQEDADNDGVGDVCEDDDHDGIPAFEDNCPFDSNKDQRDVDSDGLGDVCDDSDDRILESNRPLIVAIIALITLLFGVLIWGLLKKLKNTR